MMRVELCQWKVLIQEYAVMKSHGFHQVLIFIATCGAGTWRFQGLSVTHHPTVHQLILSPFVRYIFPFFTFSYAFSSHYWFLGELVPSTPQYYIVVHSWVSYIGAIGTIWSKFIETEKERAEVIIAMMCLFVCSINPYNTEVQIIPSALSLA